MRAREPGFSHRPTRAKPKRGFLAPGGIMNWDQIEGQWKQFGSQVKSQWAKFTDDDVKNLSAKKDDLIGKIQERYGILKEEAEHQVDHWLKSLKPHQDTSSTTGDRPTNH
jgi:uncharacterized protein YjbJ (UPF0337 family)